MLRRIRHLLRVFYDAKITGRKPAEFNFCDVEDMNKVGVDLHECGATLQFMHDRFRALFRHAPDMDAFILDEPLDVGRWRTAVYEKEQALKADPETTFDDKWAMNDEEDLADSDFAAYQMVYFVGEVLATWITLAPAMSRGKPAAFHRLP